MTNPTSSPPTAEPTRIQLPREARDRLRFDSEGPRMLPGMAMVALFLLVYSIMNVVAVLRGMVPNRVSGYYILAVSSLIAVGVFGFLRLRRWGWAMVLAGSLFAAVFYAVVFLQTHAVGLLVWTGFFTVFFLYLVRDEVRSRVR